MLEQKQQIYGFDNYRLDVRNRELLHDGKPVALPGKAFDMLVVLVKNRGRLIQKDELFSRVWPDQIVEESNLTVQVSAIRKALGERKEHTNYIVTVPGHGYRFTGNLISLDAEEEEVVIERHAISRLTVETEGANWTDDKALITNLSTQNDRLILLLDMPTRRTDALSSAGFPSFSICRPGNDRSSLVVVLGLKRTESPDKNPSRKQIKSIAVLPFKPPGGSRSETNHSRIRNGTDTLITRLSHVEQLTVRPTSAVRQYTRLEDEAAKAGRELLVDAVLDGSIQKFRRPGEGWLCDSSALRGARL